jgi:hypothetical protein
MSSDPAVLFLDLIASAVGFVLLAYGRKQRRWPQMVGGVLFCIYPYLCESVTSMVVAGIALGAAVWLAIRQGW